MVFIAGITNIIHAQDITPTPNATGVEVIIQPTIDMVEVPVLGTVDDNSGAVMVTYNAFSDIFKIIPSIVVASGVFSLGTIALVIRLVRQDKDVIKAAQIFREKQPEIINATVDNLTELLNEIALLLKATCDPADPPLEDAPVG